MVILGAGLDTRGYRLARHSDIGVFEVDQQVNIARKAVTVRRALGSQPPSVRLVPIDFERDDLFTELAKAGYRTDSRTFFVWEGVTQYLTPDAVRTTLSSLQAADSSNGGAYFFWWGPIVFGALGAVYGLVLLARVPRLHL